MIDSDSAVRQKIVEFAGQARRYRKPEPVPAVRKDRDLDIREGAGGNETNPVAA